MREMTIGDSLCGAEDTASYYAAEIKRSGIHIGDVLCMGDEGIVDADEFYDANRPSQRARPGPSAVSRAVDGRYGWRAAGFRHVVMYKFARGASAAHKRAVMQALAELPAVVTDAQGEAVVGYFSFGADLKFQEAAAAGGAYLGFRRGYLY
jgi:hypothetical protein